MEKQLELVRGSVTLRPYRSGDAQAVYEAALESFHEVGKFMPWCHAGYTLEESSNWIKACSESWGNGSAYEFAILDSQNARYLGGCGLNQINRKDKTANLGSWVRTGATGKGIAPASALLLAGFAFSELKFNRVEIVAAVENIKSQRVAEKTGAKREGILRNRILINGIAHDAVAYSLIPSDFMQA
jgi:RimJ/RimL family protein N-acetyltransferase